MSTAKKLENQLEVGNTAPTFDLPTDGSGNINLADLKGKNVVVYFYPKDDTPGCTIEAKDFRDMKDDFEAANTAIIGISKDTEAKHCKFIEKYSLNFALASDENGTACEDYGVWVEKNMYGKKYMGIQRATFLINSEGKIAQIWPKVKVKDHVTEVLEAAKSLN